MERLHIPDFEGINNRLEALERRPNEPAELFLFRASEILRESLPDEMKRDGLLPSIDKNAGNLLFAHPETAIAVNGLLKRIEEQGYFPPGKFIQEADSDIDEWIYPANITMPEEGYDVSTPEAAVQTFRRSTNARNFFQTNRYFPNTMQDGIIENTFLLSELHSRSSRAYMHQRIDGKQILLIGGNDSCKDLLDGTFHPKKMVNVDPFTASESIEKNKTGIYESFPYAAEDPKLTEKLNQELFEEIWANFSVPMYSRDPASINRAFDNMVSLLAEGGTARIYPLSVHHDFSIPESERRLSDSMYDALILKIKELIQRPDLNVFYIQTNPHSVGTLFIQKLKA